MLLWAHTFQVEADKNLRVVSCSEERDLERCPGNQNYGVVHDANWIWTDHATRNV